MIHITTGEEANRGCIQGRRIPVLYSKAGPGCPRGGKGSESFPVAWLQPRHEAADPLPSLTKAEGSEAPLKRMPCKRQVLQANLGAEQKFPQGRGGRGHCCFPWWHRRGTANPPEGPGTPAGHALLWDLEPSSSPYFISMDLLPLLY